MDPDALGGALRPGKLGRQRPGDGPHLGDPCTPERYGTQRPGGEPQVSRRRGGRGRLPRLAGPARGQTVAPGRRGGDLFRHPAVARRSSGTVHQHPRHARRTHRGPRSVHRHPQRRSVRHCPPTPPSSSAGCSRGCTTSRAESPSQASTTTSKKSPLAAGPNWRLFPSIPKTGWNARIRAASAARRATPSSNGSGSVRRLR